MKKTLSTLIGTSVVAGMTALGATQAQAATFGCEPEILGKVSPNTGCERTTDVANDTPAPAIVNSELFFGISDWVFLDKNEGNAGDATSGLLQGTDGTGLSGNWIVDASVFSTYDTVMLIFKDGSIRGETTGLVGYTIDVASGTWDTPFVDPPFANAPADGKAVSHISLYGYTQATGTVPEPLTILGAGAAIGFGASFKRKLDQAKKKGHKKA